MHARLTDDPSTAMAEPPPTRVRVRFAPSPTGLLHVGGLRTALYNYLFARRHGGAFLLRIEDTDQERFVEGAEEDIRGGLAWAGLLPFGESGVGEEQEIHRQSAWKDLYAHHARQLIEAGHAYYAFDTPEELESMRERRATPQNPAPRYDAAVRMEMNNSLRLPDAEVRRRIQWGDPHVVRLKVPPGTSIRFCDRIRQDVSFSTEEVDDQVLLKSDGMPTYHLAHVVDDHRMGITHVVRGEEWLSSTPKHLLLYRAFGWTPPTMAHLPLILSPGGGKLSKRHAEKAGIPIAVRAYRESGYEPEALVNFLAFLGWNPGTDRELFSLDELAEVFSLERVGASSVQFDLGKLHWYNQQHLRGLSPNALTDRVRPFLDRQGIEADPCYVRKVVLLMRERIGFAKDVAERCSYFFEDPEEYDPAGIAKRWKEDSPELLLRYADRLDAAGATHAEAADGMESILRALAEERGVGAGRIIHPTRLAVSGVSFGPSLFPLMEILGKETCIRRMRKIIDALS